jgi:hypothetical protein
MMRNDRRNGTRALAAISRLNTPENRPPHAHQSGTSENNPNNP